MRRLVLSLIPWLALCCAVYAQATLPGFPPGTFQDRAAIDPSSCSPISPPSGGLYDSAALTDSWSVSDATLTTNSLLSPACTTTAAALKEDSTASAIHQTNKQTSVTLTVAAHTATAYVKQSVGTRNIQLQVNDSTFADGAGGLYNVGPCTVQSSFIFGSYSGPSATATAAGNSWCKVTLSFTAILSTNPYIFLDLVSGSSNSYNGDGVSTNGLWGVDLR